MLKKLVPIVIGVLSVVIPIIIYYASLTERALSYEYIGNSSLIRPLGEIKDIKVSYKNHNVEHLSIINLRVANTGSEPLRKEDFETPLRVIFNTETEVLDVISDSKTPENLSLNYEVKGQTIFITPLLLNVGDSFELGILSSSDRLPKLQARVAGVKRIDEIKPEDVSIIFKVLSYICSVALGILYGKFYWQGILSKANRASSLITAGVCAISVPLVLRGKLELNSLESFILALISGVLVMFIGRYLANIELKKQFQQ